MQRQIRDGADIVDVGAESARTNREAISEAEEVERFKGFLQAWPSWVKEARPKDQEQVWPPMLSLNTWRSEVIEQILPLGGDILNDMSALPDGRNAKLAAQHGMALVIMHSVGQPKVAHTHVHWRNIMEEMTQTLEDKVALAKASGLQEESLCSIQELICKAKRLI